MAPYTLFPAGSVLDNYIQIYTYQPSISSDFPFGYLQSQPPITAHSFGLSKMWAIDFVTYNEFVFVVDNYNNAVIRFTYTSNQVQNVHIFWLDGPAFGINVFLHKGRLMMYLVRQQQVQEYEVSQLQSSFKPHYTQSFWLPVSVNSIAQVQATSNFVSINY